MRTRLAPAAVVAVLLVGTGFAAARQPATPAFDAASIKVNKSGEAGGRYGLRPGQVIVTNYTLRDIIRNAWGLQRYQIVEGPDWLAQDRFDITAKAPDGTAQPQLQTMMQALLAERFTLRVHREMRDLPIYELVPASRDRRLGPKMQEAAFDCAVAAAARARGETVVPPQPVGDMPVCGARANPGRLLAGNYRVSDFARNLSGFAGRAITDRTGLTGIYNFDLTWTPDEPPPPGASLPPWYDPNGPSLFTAVQEQLGLKLEPATGPVDVLVIDSAERPTAN
jgi:uncharacterized protein (TIGR03435 family)